MLAWEHLFSYIEPLVGLFMRRPVLMVPLFLLGVSGCYDGQELVDRALQRVVDDHRAEIDLGRYRVTLPRQSSSPIASTLELEVVAMVDRKNVRKIKQQLEGVQTRMQHATLLTLRRSRPDDLVEADFASLRERVEATTEEYLTVAPIESIAFKSFAVYED